MAHTGPKAPHNADNVVDNGPPWTWLYNVENQMPWAGATEGSSYTGHVDAHCVNVPAGAWSDWLYAHNYGFNINLNSRIDGVITKILRGGHHFVDGHVVLMANGKASSDRKKYRYRTDTKLLVDTYGSSTDKWGYTSSQLTPAIVNSSSFGVREIQKNLNKTAETPGIFVMVLDVYYTDPTYSFTCGIDSVKVVGDLVTYTLTLKNTNSIHQGYGIPVSISIPAGLDYVSQSGNGTFNTSTGKWNANLANGEATLTLTLQSSTTGNKTITASVDGFSTTISKNVTINPPSYVLASDLPELINEGEQVNYNISVLVDSNIPETVDVNVPVPEGFTYVSSTGDGTYTSGTGVWTAALSNRTATLNLTLQAVTPEEYTQTLSIEGGFTLSKTIIIASSTLTDCGYCIRECPEHILNSMVDGKTYNISCYCKVSDSAHSKVYPGPKNFKIAVVQGENEVIGSRVIALDSIERIYVPFIYNAAEVPMVKLYGQYNEISPEDADIYFFGFARHLGYDVDYEDPGILFDDPAYLADLDDYAVAVVPSNRKTNPVLFEDINLAGRESDPTLIVKGFGIKFDYYAPDEVGVKVTLMGGDQVSTKSTILNPDEQSATIGGSGDKWSLNVDEVDLSQMSFKIEFSNVIGDEQNVQIKNVRFVLYSQHDETRGNYGFTLDGEHSRNYNLFVTKDWDKPEGLDKDIDTLDLKKTDGDLITGASNKSKTIKVKFYVIGKDLPEMQARLIEAVAWMSSNPDPGRRPIPKTLVFDWDETRRYEVILKSAISVDFEIGKMECEAQFLLPKGSAQGPERETGATDVNKGLTSVRPVIQIKTDGSEEVVIYENKSGQVLTIDYEFEEDTILFIDCDNLMIYDKEGTDYSSYLTPDSSYPFINPGYFDFAESTGCYIQKIIFSEGE